MTLPGGWRRSALIAALIAAAAVIAPLALSQFYLGLVTLGLVYGLFAFGLDIVWGRAGIVSIGHATFFGIGAYGVAIASEHGVWTVAGAAAGVAGATLVAVVIGLAGLRRRATPGTMAVLTLGVTLLAAQVATAWTGVTGGTNGIFVLESLSTASYYWVCVAVCAIVVAACQVLVFRSAIGNRLVAIRVNAQRASHLGIDVRRHRILALALGAAVSAVAGALGAPLAGLVSPELVGILLSTQVLIWVAIGGRNTLLGPFVGAMLATIGENELSSISVDFYLLILGALFVLVVVVAPNGIVGAWRRAVEVLAPWRLRLGRGLARRAAPDAAPSERVLAVDEAVKRFGATPAVDGVSLDVGPREIVCLIGPNGAGKTTLLNCISGDHDLDGGSIALAGRPVGHAPPHRRTQLGLGRTFQVPSLLSELTVAEHLTLVHQEARRIPDLPGVYRRFEGPLAEQRARELSLGDRRSLEIALALAGDPRLLLLDEPAAGLSRDEAVRLADTLLEVRERIGCAMVAVEHDMEIVRRLADRVVVLHQGVILSEGSMDEVSADERVRDAYLGAR